MNSFGISITTHLTVIDCDTLECPAPVPRLEYSGLSVINGDVAHCELLIPNVHSVLP
jgi:hypothetical protein